MDAVELQIKLSWAERQLEERNNLVEHLRDDVARVVQENIELSDKVAKLKAAQEQLLHDKLATEQRYQQALTDKAELASTNAQLHQYAREAGMKAEAAIKTSNELRALADARSKADALMLSSSTDTDATPHNTNTAQLHACRILISRLLRLLQAHNVNWESELPALCADPRGDAVSSISGGSIPAATIQKEMESVVGTLPQSSQSSSESGASSGLSTSPQSASSSTPEHSNITEQEDTESDNSDEVIATNEDNPSGSRNPFTVISNGFWRILVGDVEPDGSPRKTRPTEHVPNGIADNKHATAHISLDDSSTESKEGVRADLILRDGNT